MIVKEFWKALTTRDVLCNVEESWREITRSSMNGIWGKISPQCVHGYKSFNVNNDLSKARRNIVKIANTVCFDEVDEGDVEELLDSDQEELSTSRSSSRSRDTDDPPPP